jgi:hypothetical protein
MAIYEVWFLDEIIHSYLNICDEFYTQDLKIFYEPGDDVPELPEKWVNAFKSPKLKYLHMDSESWNYSISIWRVLNIDISADEAGVAQKKIKFPLPALARIVPMVISLWNSLKGGGDSITKLLDGCKEKIGMRTECIMASARLILYFAVMFHRLHQWCNAKNDLNFYYSAEHARDANNKRSTFAKSLALLCGMLLTQARREQLSEHGEDALDKLTVHYNEILANPQRDNELDTDAPGRRKTRSRSNSTPGPVELDAPGGKTGITPKHRNKTNPLFIERCRTCIGLYFGKRVSDPTVEKTAKDERLKRICYVCGAKTDYFCFGCRRWLCMSPPKSSDPEQPEPKYFSTNTPVLDKDGELQFESDGSVKTVKEYGHWTCFHKAHEPGWKTYIQLNRVALMDRGTSNEAKRARRHSIG